MVQLKIKWTKQKAAFSLLAVCLLASLVWNAVLVSQSNRHQEALYQEVCGLMDRHIGYFPLSQMADEDMDQYDFLNDVQDLNLLIDGLYASAASYSAASSMATLDREWSEKAMRSYGLGQFYSRLALNLSSCRNQLQEGNVSEEDAKECRKMVDDILLIRSWIHQKIIQGDSSFYGEDDFTEEFQGKLQSHAARFWFGNEIIKKP